jgi:hypothetical protein
MGLAVADLYRPLLLAQLAAVPNQAAGRGASQHTRQPWPPEHHAACSCAPAQPNTSASQAGRSDFHELPRLLPQLRDAAAGRAGSERAQQARLWRSQRLARAPAEHGLAMRKDSMSARRPYPTP